MCVLWKGIGGLGVQGGWAWGEEKGEDGGKCKAEGRRVGIYDVDSPHRGKKRRSRGRGEA